MIHLLECWCGELGSDSTVYLRKLSFELERVDWVELESGEKMALKSWLVDT